MDRGGTCAGFFLLILLLGHVECFSKVPTEFSNFTWYSNIHGDLQFTTTELQNWTVGIAGLSTVNWFIVDDTRYNDSGGYIVFRSVNNYTINGTDVFAFMCTHFNKEKENLYTYYNLHAQESQFGDERVVLKEESNIESFESICDVTFVSDPDDVHLLAKKGSANFNICPEQLVAKIVFTAQNINTTGLCQDADNLLDGCTDNTKLQISSDCGYSLAFSANGSLSCLTETTAGNEGIIYLLNMDTEVDNVNTFRFACMALSQDGTILSIIPRRCLTNHTTSYFPPSVPGQRMFVKIRAKCLTYVSKAYDETKALWIKIGIPVGVVILFVIIFVICLIVACMRVRRKQINSGKGKFDNLAPHVDTNHDKRHIIIVRKDTKLAKQVPKPPLAVMDTPTRGNA